MRELARAVVRRGGEVEVLSPRPNARLPSLESAVIRRLSLSTTNLPFSMARAVSKHLHSAHYDIVHVQTQEALLAVGATRDRPRGLVFTPDASIRRLLHGRLGPATGWVLSRSAGIVCRANVEAELLERLVPTLSDRVAVVRAGVDVASIRAAAPIGFSGEVVLSVGPLERHGQLASTIAALAALAGDFHLVAIGDGPGRRSLDAFAADLQVRSRVHFLGRRPTSELYRWLRTARALVAMSGNPPFPISLIEAAAAGAPVVASDIPIHREVASYARHAGVMLIPLESSPLAIADAIDAAARTRLALLPLDSIPSLTDMAERTVDVYAAVVSRRPPLRTADVNRRRQPWARSAAGHRADADLSGSA
jgi:glycosyltransferase involved in cell wall biosynthesis